MNAVTQSRTRNVQRILGGIATVIAVAISLWIIYFGIGDISLPPRQHANAVLGAGIAIFYFLGASDTLDEVTSKYDLVKTGWFTVLAMAALAAAAYVHLNYFRWLNEGRVFIFGTVDVLVGAIVLFVVIDVTYRKYGKLLAGVILATLLYGYVGPLLPGILQHSGMSPYEIIARNTITLTGVYGFLLQVGATWIAIFIIFAGLIEEHGGFDYILEIGSLISDKSQSGVAQTAVITSMFMGTMMGSSASNVATTGSFTIPLMEDQGIPPRFAAATESIASTGGQILPPIMGTAAFIMADIIDMPYAEIAIGGIVPALLFYVAVSVGIHYEMVKNGWTARTSASISMADGVEEGGERVSRGELLRRGVQYIIPVVVLIYLLMIAQYGPMLAGVYTIATLMLTRGIYQAVARDPVEFVRDTFDGLRTGGENLAPFIAMTGALGIVITIISQTSLSQKIAINMLILSGGIFVLTLLLAMFVGLLFGLGMPTPAAYILVATIVAPGLVQLGVPTLSAHLYLFYFALLSAITPPIAVAVAVAVGIADANFVDAAKDTLKLGLPIFLIPFIFVANSEIIMWTFPATGITVPILMVGIWALVNALTGFNGSRQLSILERTAAAVLGIGATLAPYTVVQASSAAAFVGLYMATARYDIRGLNPLGTAEKGD